MSVDQAIACYQTDTILRKTKKVMTPNPSLLYRVNEIPVEDKSRMLEYERIQFCTQRTKIAVGNESRTLLRTCVKEHAVVTRSS